MGEDLGDASVDGGYECSLFQVSIHLAHGTRSTLYESLGSPLVFTLSAIDRHIILATSGTLGGLHGT